jgi:hypothetical protein
MSRNYRHIGLTAIRYILGILFLLSGIGKLIDSSDARYLVELAATEYYALIEYTGLIIITVSVAELAIAVFLLWGRYLKTALAASMLLLGFFTTVLGYFYLQGQTVASCGCFGAFGGGGGLGFTLIRNLVLLALVVGGFMLLAPKTQPVAEEE